ncbi:MAG: hypothetical protein K2I42_02490, partial [Anaeroplasmataceae bacterium]|nr:hypothetical protein [Anaeroplasmataceae bacterium]
SIGVSIFSLILIGRIGIAGRILALFFAFIFGDFSTIILMFIFVYSICFILLKKKIDFHHISFIGVIFILLSLLMFAHLGLYDALGMKNTTVLTKTVTLYRHYLKSYQISYSCGGGIIGALLLQLTCLLVSKIGSILIGIAFLLIGISYMANIQWFKIFKSGKLTKIPKQMVGWTKDYFKNLHYPTTFKKPVKKISIHSLEDSEGQTNFTLQEEINKERYEGLKRYIRDKKIYGMLDASYTSYTSSRIVLKFANKNESDFQTIVGYFNRQCFLIKNDNEYYLDYPNQFRKLLTLKNFLAIEEKTNYLSLALDVNGNLISMDITGGKMLVVIGDRSSGIKTFIRSLILSILIKNIKYSDIYFYDFDNEFINLDKKAFIYVNNEKSASIALDEAFSEYERRSEVLKYFNCETILEANAMIKKTNSDMELIYPEFHFFLFDLSKVSPTLLQKITYAIRFSVRVGITIIAVARSKNALSHLELNKSDVVAFNMNDVSASIKLFGSDIACRLQKKGDVLIRKNGVLYHGQTPYVSLSDFEKIDL